MAKPVRDARGRYAGSLGAGKAAPSPAQGPRAANRPESAPEVRARIDAAYQEFVAARAGKPPIMLPRGSGPAHLLAEWAVAGQHAWYDPREVTHASDNAAYVVSDTGVTGILYAREGSRPIETVDGRELRCWAVVDLVRAPSQRSFMAPTDPRGVYLVHDPAATDPGQRYVIGGIDRERGAFRPFTDQERDRAARYDLLPRFGLERDFGQVDMRAAAYPLDAGAAGLEFRAVRR